MGIDWHCLIRLRERKQATAQGRAAEAQALQHEKARLRQRAEGEWRQQLQAREDHAASTAQALEQGGFRIEQLRHAGAWHRTLEQRIVQASQRVQDAAAAEAQQQALLDERRAALRAAAAQLQRAQELQRREGHAAHRLRELRADDEAEEVSLTLWRQPAAGRRA